MTVKEAKESFLNTSITKERYLEIISVVAKETSEKEQCTKHIIWNDEKELFYLSPVFDKRTVETYTNGMESDLKIVISVAQETSEREQCTKHVNWNNEKEMYFLSDVYVQDLTFVSYTNGIKR
jgi:hypothetical protein